MSLLTVDELKGYIQDTAESDATLEQRIADNEAELTERFGPLEIDDDAIATVTERIWIRGHQVTLTLRQDADEIISITPTTAGVAGAALATTAHGLRSRRELYLVAGGPWAYDHLDVVYRPADRRGRRRRALIKLIQLEMNYQPGMGAQSGGPWSEQYAGGSYEAQREAIMATVEDAELFA
jgi:hypothetical protein